MTLLVHMLLGVALGAMGAVLLQPVLAAPAFARRNYRDNIVPTAAGLAIVLAVLTVVAATTIGDAAGWTGEAEAQPGRAAMAAAALGFGFLGLLDDLGGAGAGGGFRGHLAALGQGRLTTGMVKLVGGALVAIVVVGPLNIDAAGWLVADAGVVALAANAGNLFDRAPGRTIKVCLLAFAVLVLVDGASAALAGPGVAIGAGAALIVPDLNERSMLGDTGANVLGAAAGLAAVLVLGHTATLVVLAALVVLNAASEWVSFSSVIDHTAPLRWFDRLGSRRS